MARNSQGVYTLPAGNPVQSATVIDSTNWGNPTMEDIGSEMTDSLSRDGKGSMRSELGIIDGTVGVPGLRFNTETGSGLVRTSAGEWGLSRLGVIFLSLSAAGVSVFKTLIVNAAADVVQAIVKGHTTQTADLHQWQDDTGTVLARIDSTGKFIGPVEGTPAGSVIGFAGASVPAGWFFCDGQAVSRTTFPALFTALGVIYGNGNGTTTFNVPDYRGEFLRGRDAGAAIDPDAGARTDRGDGTGGDVVGSKQLGDNEAHVHAEGSLAAGSHVHGLGSHVHGSSGLGTNTTGDHFHSLNFVATTGSGSGLRSTATGAGINTTSAGDHAHTLTGNVDAAVGDTDGAGTTVTGSVASTGGAEARPRNTNIDYIIRAA